MNTKLNSPVLSASKDAGVPLIMSHKHPIRNLIPVVLAVMIILGLLLPSTLQANAAALLTITPITWNTVGLNSADVKEGQNVFLVGASVCNTGDAAASNVLVNLVWDSENTYIQTNGPGSSSLSSLAAKSCQDFYFSITVSRDSDAFNTSRRYHITAQAAGIPAVSTPAPREIYIEEMLPRSNLATTSITGPDIVEVGRTYEYVVTQTTGTEDYAQLVHSLAFPTNILRLQSASAVYTAPDQTNNKIYADACRWRDDPSDPIIYRTCTPDNPIYPGGAISSTLVTTYTVQILTTGTATLEPVLFGYTGEEYYYAADFGEDTLVVNAVQPANPTPTYTMTPVQYLPDIMKNAVINPTATTSPSPTVSPTITPSPTHTGTTTPQIVVGKTAPVQIQGTINTSFTFTVRVSNTGTHPATSIIINDSVATYPFLELTGVTTDRGTATRNSSTSVTINIPVLNPNETATITITGRIRNNVTGTPQACNLASLTFTGGAITTPQPRNSNNACFRIQGGAVLPGTGELPLESATTGVNGTLLSLSLVLGAAGLFAFWFALKSYRRQQGTALPVFAAAVFLCISAVFIYLVSTDIINRPSFTGNQPEANLVTEVEVSLNTVEPLQEASATVNPLAIAPAYLFSTPMPHPEKTLPVFPIPSPTLEITPGPGENMPDTSPIKRLSIPSIDLHNAQVAYVPFDGQTWLIEGLREEIAWMGDTSWPGLGGNTGLAAHVTVRGLGNGPFRYLSDLRSGDTITLHTEKNAYTYTVRDKKVVAETDLSVIEQTDESRLTLITCINWHEEWELYIDRMVIIADLVRVEPLTFSFQSP
jgi:LPXTG-site transpeptidase (sortase) family protein